MHLCINASCISDTKSNILLEYVLKFILYQDNNLNEHAIQLWQGFESGKGFPRIPRNFGRVSGKQITSCSLLWKYQRVSVSSLKPFPLCSFLDIVLEVQEKVYVSSLRTKTLYWTQIWNLHFLPPRPIESSAL